MLIYKLKTGRYMCLLEQMGLGAAITAQCVINGVFGDCSPSCLQINSKLLHEVLG